MCEVMRKYEDVALTKGKAEGRAEEKNLIRQKMMLAGIPAEQIEAVLA